MCYHLKTLFNVSVQGLNTRWWCFNFTYLKKSECVVKSLDEILHIINFYKTEHVWAVWNTVMNLRISDFYNSTLIKICFKFYQQVKVYFYSMPLKKVKVCAKLKLGNRWNWMHIKPDRFWNLIYLVVTITFALENYATFMEHQFFPIDYFSY
jgi:hypothetical protein